MDSSASSKIRTRGGVPSVCPAAIGSIIFRLPCASVAADRGHAGGGRRSLRAAHLLLLRRADVFGSVRLLILSEARHGRRWCGRRRKNRGRLPLNLIAIEARAEVLLQVPLSITDWATSPGRYACVDRLQRG